MSLYLNLGFMDWAKRDNENLFIHILFSLIMFVDGKAHGGRVYFWNGLVTGLSFERVKAISLKDVNLDRYFNDNRWFLHFQGYFKYFCGIDYIDRDLIDQWFHLHLNRYLENIIGFELNWYFHQVGLISFNDLYLWLQLDWHLHDANHFHCLYHFHLHDPLDYHLHWNLYYLLDHLHLFLFFVDRILLENKLDASYLYLILLVKDLFIFCCCLESFWLVLIILMGVYFLIFLIHL